MTDTHDDEKAPAKRDLLLAALGADPGSKTAVNEPIGEQHRHKEIYVPFTVAENVYVVHDDVRYQLVKDGDGGLKVVVADD